MTPILFAAGVIVLIVVSFDVISTTIALTTRYTPTSMIARLLFGVLRRIAQLGGRRLVTSVAGTLVMMAVAATWIGGTWVGWSLVHASVPGSVEVTAVGAEPEAHDYWARTGQLLSTLGGGQTEAGTPIWSVVSVFVGVNGMVVLTLSVSFLLSVRETVRMGRAFAALQDADAAPPGPDTLPRLAELVAALHAAPFALWYGNPRRARQLPAALLAHAEDAADAGGETWRKTRAILKDLPHLDDDPKIDALRHWAQSHSISDVRRASKLRAAV